MSTKANFTIMHDYVMLFPLAKAKNVSGIIIKESIDATAPIEGYVVGVGPGKPNKNGDIIPLSVKTGDRVIFIGNAGKIVQHEGDKFIVVPMSEILCKIDYEQI